ALFLFTEIQKQKREEFALLSLAKSSEGLEEICSWLSSMSFVPSFSFSTVSLLLLKSL
ncbi:hypothetical protein KI387_035181, partial [Taxus chinensis]